MSEYVGRWNTGALPPCVAIVLDQQEMGPECKSWLTFELALRGIYLDTNEDILRDGIPIGLFRFLELEQTTAVLQAARDKASLRGCPWAGRIRGAIGWMRLGLESELLRDFLPFLAFRCRGPFINTDNGEVHEPLRKITFPLRNLLGKFGFEDGDALLSHDADYLDYVCLEAKAALTKAGIKAEVGAIEAHHNPVRIWGPLRRLDGREEVRDWELSSPSMTIWAYDDSFLKEVAFW